MAGQDMHPLVISFWRCLFAAVPLLLFLRKDIFKIPSILKNEFHAILMLSSFGMALFNVLLFSSLVHTTATSSSIIINSNPLFILVFAAFFLRECITLRKVMAVSAGFAGCFLVIYSARAPGSAAGNMMTGNLLAVGAALCWAFYTVRGKRLVTGYGPVTITFISLALSAFMLFLLALFSGVSLTGIPAGSFIGVIYMGVVPAGIGFTFWYKALRYMPAGKLGIFQYIAPLVAVILSSAFLDEKPGMIIFAGMVLIASSFYLFSTVREGPSSCRSR